MYRIFFVRKVTILTYLVIGVGLFFVFILSGQNFALASANNPCHLAVTLTNGLIIRYNCSPRLDTQTAIDYLQQQPQVQKVSPIQKYHIALEPNDPKYDQQKFYLEQINAPVAWDKTINIGYRPVIAILDSGVDLKNPDLIYNLWFNPWEVPGDKQDNDQNGYVDDQYGWDFVTNTPDPSPKFDTGWTTVAMQHGTIVAGVAAAQGNNAQGVAGVAWSARIMPIRVLNGQGSGDTVTVASGIDYAIQNHADIINLSFVGGVSDPILEDAIARAYRAGILIVAASGNEQQIGVDMDKTPQYPVCNDGWNGENQVIGVAAITDTNARAEFSNYGSRCIDLSAPGVRIFSTHFVSVAQKNFTDCYGGYWSGTSVAAPMVSGALALLKSVYPRLSPSQLKEILIAAGDQINNFNPSVPSKLGRRLNVAAALTIAGGSKFPVKSPVVLVPQSGLPSNVLTYDVSGELLQKFLAYQPKFISGSNITTGDVDGDGQVDIIIAPRAGGGPNIRMFNQKGELEFQFMAFADTFRGGVSVAAADFTGDGKDDIVVGTGRGGSNLVRVYDSQGILRYQFIPYEPSYIGGINLVAGDVDSDGQPDIVVAPAGGARLPVRVFDKFGVKRSEFYPFPVAIRGGINVAVGDVDGDNKADIIVAAGAGGGPQVRVFNWRGKVLQQFLAYAKNFRGGVNVAVGDVDGDGNNEIVTSPGAGGGPHIRMFTYKGEVRSEFFIEPTTGRGGYTLAVFR